MGLIQADMVKALPVSFNEALEPRSICAVVPLQLAPPSICAVLMVAAVTVPLFSDADESLAVNVVPLGRCQTRHTDFCPYSGFIGLIRADG